MRDVVFLMCLVSLISCIDKKTPGKSNFLPPNSKFVTTDLGDSLGKVTMAIPLSYDTFFNWVDLSDCGKPCETIDYRYQPKSANITLESGFICRCDPTDSVNQITIGHSGWFETGRVVSKKEFFNWHHDYKLSLLLLRPNATKNTSDTILRIHDRYFSIFITDNFVKVDKCYNKLISASTLIKGNQVGFTFRLYRTQNDSITKHFISNSMKLLHTVRIEKCF